MPKLILSMDGLVLKEIALRQERLTIGRKADNDVQIDNLAISGHHAVITTILDDAFLEDQNSTNGTYVNGQPVKKHVLRDSDVIELGKYRLKFLADTDASALSRSGFVRDAEPRPAVVAAASAAPGAEPASPVAPAPSPGRAGGQQMGVVQILDGANAGRELELAKAVTTLGKPGKQVAVITRRAQGYFITHVEGASFPQVNGRAIDARAHPLSPGDLIDIAGVRMTFGLRP